MALRTYGRNFWRQAAERALKTAAQASALAGAALAGNVLDLGVWQSLGSAAAGGFVLSIITSIATAPAGPSDDPSLVEPVPDIAPDGRPLH